MKWSNPPASRRWALPLATAALLVSLTAICGCAPESGSDAGTPSSTPPPVSTESLTPAPSATASATENPGTSPLTIGRSPNGEIRALFTGDSLTEGFFATSEADGFVSLISDALGGLSLTTAARAHNSLTTVAAITDVPPDLGLAVIELGTNDVGIPTPIADFEAQYNDLIDRIRASSPDAALVCAGTWTGWGDDYDNVIKNACTAADGRYVDFRPLFDDPTNRGPVGIDTPHGQSDDFHPNNQGHRAIADAILAVLATE